MDFAILGPLQVERAGEPVRLGGRQRALLSVLLLHPNTVVSTARLIDAIWDDPPASAVPNLHGYVTQLRRGVAPDLATEAHGYRLPVPRDRLDLFVFEDTLREARRAAGHGALAAANEHYRAALALWRGEPAEDVVLTGVMAPRIAELTELADAARADWTDLRLRLGLHDGLIAELRAATKAQPLRERLWRQLLLALCQASRKAEALEAYRRARDMLVAELGVEPGPELRDLHRAILDDAPVLRPEPPAAERSVLPVPRQLPPVTGAFVGRAGPLRRLDELRDGQARTVLLVGPAGVGKTTLALRWAHTNAARFPDGQFFVPLRGFDPGTPAAPAEALARMLGPLGVAADDIPADLEDQSALLRSLLAGRRALIVLDDAAGPEQIRPLLPGGAGCFVLVTSRDRLGGLVARDGAQRICLDVLAGDDALELLGDTAGHDRTAAEPEAAARLTELCGHLPLALRVAGARLADRSDYPLARFAADLSDQGRLTGLQVDGDARAAVRPAFELSYQALDSDARRLFRLLGLAPGLTVTTGAAAALADVPRADAAEELEALARVHMLQPAGPDRYACHDLLHAYAAEQAVATDDADARADALRRLLAYSLASLRAAAAAEYGLPTAVPDAALPGGVTPETFAERAAAESWLDTEWNSLAGLIEHACAHGPRDFGWRLVDVALDVLHHRRPRGEWVHLAETALAAAERDGDTTGQAAMYLSLGQARWRSADLHGSLQAYEHALRHAQAARWRHGEATALRAGGVALKQLGRLPEALSRYHRAAMIDRSIGHHRGEAADLNNLASVSFQLGRLDDAERHVSQALPLSLRTGHANLEAVNRANLGNIHLERGRTAAALEAVEASLSVARGVGALVGESLALGVMGRVHAAAGRTGKAVAAYRESLELARRAENRIGQVDALAGLAETDLGRRRAHDALARLHEAVELARDTEYREGEVRVLIALAHTCRSAGELSAAARHASQAARLAVAGDVLWLLGRAYTARADVAAGRGDAAGCRRWAERAVRTLSVNGQRLALPSALLLLAEARAQLGDEGGAARTRRRAHALLAEFGMPAAEPEARLDRTPAQAS